MPASVAVIDIGSNSIKLLIAARGADGGIVPVKIRTIDARISAGISGPVPRLSDEGIRRGLDAVHALLEDIAAVSATQVLLVATSAVRDAQNGLEFRDRLRVETGHEVRILSGDEEANLIGRGLTADPALRALRDFYVFDLGGGSLECLAFRDRAIAQAVSLQLGCVRLTEKFVTDPAQEIPGAVLSAVKTYTREVLAPMFAFSLPQGASAVGTGGTVTTVRAILGARAGKPFEETAATVTVAQLRELLDALSVLPLAERMRIPGLPPARADIFPVALATLIAVAEAGGFRAFENSTYNLRYGLADQALDALGSA